MDIPDDLDERAFDALAWAADGYLPRWDGEAWNRALTRQWVWLRVVAAPEDAKGDGARIRFGATRLGERELAEWMRKRQGNEP